MRRPSPSLVVSCIALFVALGGTAIAASTIIKSSSQVKNGVITGADIKNGSITGRDIKSRSISSSKLASRVGATSVGANGGGTAVEVVRRSGPSLPQPGGATVATMRGLAPGAYAIFAKTTLAPDKDERGLGELLRSDRSGTGHCVLDAGGDVDDAREAIAGPGTQQPSTLNLQITRTVSQPIDVTLVCDSNQPFKAADTSIIAVKLASVQRSDVTE